MQEPLPEYAAAAARAGGGAVAPRAPGYAPGGAAAALPSGAWAKPGGAREASPSLAALAAECSDLTARLAAAQARSAALEAELVRVAEPLPAYGWLLSLPGVGPTLAAILLAEIGDIGWYSKFSHPAAGGIAGLDIIWIASGKWAGTPRISKAGRPLLRWALYQAALGACRNAQWRARREALIAKRKGDRFAFFKATVELGAKLLRLLWGVWRSGRPYDPLRTGGLTRQPR